MDWSNASVDERGQLTVPLTGEGDNVWQQAFDATIYLSEGLGPDVADGIVLAGDAITVSDVSEGSEAEVGEVLNKVVREANAEAKHVRQGIADEDEERIKADSERAKRMTERFRQFGSRS